MAVHVESAEDRHVMSRCPNNHPFWWRL